MSLMIIMASMMWVPFGLLGLHIIDPKAVPSVFVRFQPSTWLAQAVVGQLPCRWGSSPCAQSPLGSPLPPHFWDGQGSKPRPRLDVVRSSPPAAPLWCQGCSTAAGTSRPPYRQCIQEHGHHGHVLARPSEGRVLSLRPHHHRGLTHLKHQFALV
jgi:hypothetical protein